MSAHSARQRRRFVRRAALLALRTLQRHYFSMLSVVVLGVLLGLVLTSDSFVSQDKRPAPRAAQEAEPRKPVQRRSVVFYIVEDQEQLRAISEAFAVDQTARTLGPFQVDHVVYLIGGTTEEESEVIARLNFETTIAQGSPIDLTVIDVRGRFSR